MSARKRSNFSRKVAAAACVVTFATVPHAPAQDEELYDRNVACTYFGHEGGERTQGVYELKVGTNAGRILIAGETYSNDFQHVFSIVPQPAQKDHADPVDPSNSLIAQSTDAYIAILSADLQHVVHWTYLGGAGNDRAYVATEESNGDIWVSGFTESALSFPHTQNQYYWGPTSITGPGANPTGMDVFVARFNNQLTALEKSTIIGGSDDENSRGTICVKGSDVYISGSTKSDNFPHTVGPPSTSSTVGATERDGFVVKLNGDATLNWSRLIVGDGDETAWANVRVDSSDTVFVAGSTTSTTITFTTGLDSISAPTNSLNGAEDGFVARLTSSGMQKGAIEAMYRIGGSGTDVVAYNDCLELDSQGRPVVMGYTRSTDFPIPSTCQPLSSIHSNVLTNNPPHALDDNDPDSNDVWVAKLSNDLSSVIYASYVNATFGARPTAFYREEPAGLALAAGSFYMSGETDSAGLPMLDSASDNTISTAVSVSGSMFHDAYLIKMFPGVNNPSVWHYSTFFGGDTTAGGTMASEHGNRGRHVVIGTLGANDDLVIFSGQSTMSDLPTTPNVVFPTLVSTTDYRAGFIAIHDAQ